MSPDSNLEDSLFGILLQDTYRIVGLIGEGGMGAVYEAMQIRLNKRVAIKVMARELATNTEALNRFHREAMITSGLGHPHIVQVFDFSSTPAGQPFLAMEYLDGEDLDRRIRRAGRLTPAQTVHIIKQVASALAATHAQDIVHRDLKPANIYLLNVAGEDDFVKVLDFGISKMRAATTKITRASAMIGTPDYMSPEQAMGMGDVVDHRTDQWALACIVWECLTGRGPFIGDSVPSILFQVVHGEPQPLASRVSDLPPGLDAVLKRALSKNKEERFSGVIELAQELEAVIVGDTAVVSQAMAIARSRPHVVREASENRAPTTFSHAAGESDGNVDSLPSRPKWHWAAAGVGAVALALAVMVAVRPRRPHRRI
jgi:serine/threonine-protein kinase